MKAGVLHPAHTVTTPQQRPLSFVGGWTIKKSVRTFRRYRQITINTGNHENPVNLVIVE